MGSELRDKATRHCLVVLKKEKKAMKIAARPTDVTHWSRNLQNVSQVRFQEELKIKLK
jgi:hypothetical protein